MHAANAVHQCFAGNVFEEIAFRPGLYGAIDVFVTIEGCKDDDPSFVVVGADFLDRVYPIDLGHPQIEQRHIRSMLPPKVNRFTAVAGFAD